MACLGSTLRAEGLERNEQVKGRNIFSAPGWGVVEESQLGIEDKYDQVMELIALGKEKGYLLYDEVNELLPADISNSEEIEDILATFWDGGY